MGYLCSAPHWVSKSALWPDGPPWSMLLPVQFFHRSCASQPLLLLIPSSNCFPENPTSATAPCLSFLFCKLSTVHLKSNLLLSWELQRSSCKTLSAVTSLPCYLWKKDGECLHYNVFSNKDLHCSSLKFWLFVHVLVFRPLVPEIGAKKNLILGRLLLLEVPLTQRLSICLSFIYELGTTTQLRRSQLSG